MGETIIEIPKRKFKYAGAFSSKDLWNMIFFHFVGRNYTPVGTLEETKAFEDETHILKKFTFERDYNENYIFKVKVKLTIVVKKQITVTVDGHKQTLDEGSFVFSQEGKVTVDDDDKWAPSEKKKWNVIVRHLFSYILLKPQRDNCIRLGKEDMAFIEDKLLAYANAHNFTR